MTLADAMLHVEAIGETQLLGVVAEFPQGVEQAVALSRRFQFPAIADDQFDAELGGNVHLPLKDLPGRFKQRIAGINLTGTQSHAMIMDEAGDALDVLFGCCGCDERVFTIARGLALGDDRQFQVLQSNLAQMRNGCLSTERSIR